MKKLSKAVATLSASVMLMTGLFSIPANAKDVFTDSRSLKNGVSFDLRVYNDSYSPPSSGVTVNSYGAIGVSSGAPIGWSGNLYLYRDATTKTLPISVTSSYTFEVNSTGSLSTDKYNLYSITCTCGNTTYGTVTVSGSGSL